MKRFITFFCIILLFAVCFYSCKKDKQPPEDMGYNYFPNQVGRYVVYDVDSIYYDNASLNPNTHLAKVDTVKFQLKEKIQSIYYDNSNRPAIRLERYIKLHSDTISYAQMPWTLRNVWAENRTSTTAEKVEENIRYIKLAFPVTSSQTWDGNAQNTLGTMNYTYNYFDIPSKINNFNFDSTLQVAQLDMSTAISKQYYIEKYVRNVGLVYKLIIDIQSQPYTGWNSLPDSLYADSTNTFINKPILQRITNGVQFIMTVNSYGTE